MPSLNTQMEQLAKLRKGRPPEPTGVSAYIKPKQLLVVADAELVETILVTQTSDFYKKAPLYALKPVLWDTPPFMNNPPEWNEVVETSPLTMRVYGEFLKNNVPVMRQAIIDYAAGASDGDYATPSYRTMGFRAWARALVGEELGFRDWDAMNTMLIVGDTRINADVEDLDEDESEDSVFQTARSRFWGAFSDRIAAVRESGTDGRVDLMSTYLRTDGRISDSALAKELANVYFGGLVSSSGVLTAAMYEITQRPRLRKSLLAELEGVDRDDYDALEGCTLLDQVVRETARLHPGVPIWMRNTDPDREVTVGQYTVAPDTEVWLFCDVPHRLASHWPAPDQFQPERWTDEVKTANPYGCGWFFPFGAGERTCTGWAWALTWIKLALAELLAGQGASVGARERYQTADFFACRVPDKVTCAWGAEEERPSLRPGPPFRR